MSISNNVTRLLSAKKVKFEAHQLPEEKLGGLEAAAFLGVPPSQVFKTIVALHPEGKKGILALVPSNHKADLKALAKNFGVSKVKAASQTQAEDITGLKTGGISPLALVDKGFSVFVDESAIRFSRIFVSGGKRGLNISLPPQDLISLTRAKLARVSKP